MCCLTAFYHLIKARFPINNTVILSSHPTPTLFLPAYLRCSSSLPCMLACSRWRKTGVPSPDLGRHARVPTGLPFRCAGLANGTAGLLHDCFAQPVVSQRRSSEDLYCTVMQALQCLPFGNLNNSIFTHQQIIRFGPRSC
jgi:hypothetical protein